MKQAILITAYKNFHHLEEIIKFFDDDFELYIHIDKKSVISKEVINCIANYSNVKLVSQKFNVNWGGFNHLKCILYLAEQALKNEKVFYIHLISGHDYPIKKLSDFKIFFKIKRNSLFINSFDFPLIGGADNGGMDRIEYYNLYDLLNAKSSRQYFLIRRILSFQMKINLRRSIRRIKLKIYGGSTWWSLNRESLTYVLNYTKENKRFLNRFRYTLCSEEYFFQTIIMNSSFSINVKKDSLRFIDWKARNGNNPAILDDTDFNKIVKSSAFFARKFEFPISKDLLFKIKKELH